MINTEINKKHEASSMEMYIEILIGAAIGAAISTFVYYFCMYRGMRNEED